MTNMQFLENFSTDNFYAFFFWNIDWLVSYITSTAYFSFKYFVSNYYLYLKGGFPSSFYDLFYDVSIDENLKEIIHAYTPYLPNFFNEISSELDLIDRINLSINFFNEVTDTVDSKLLLNSIRYDQNLFYKNIILWDDWLQINDPMLGWNSSILMNTPELSNLIPSYYQNYFSPFFLTFFNDNSFIVIETVTITFSNFIAFFYFFILIKLFLFPFFFSASDNENVFDADYAISSMIGECEKEIAAIDDLITVFLALIFIFGIYFLMYGFIQFFYFINNFVLIFLILPLFIFFIYVAPLCLLFDFGIYCFVYIRGSGPTSALAVELMYDLINLFAYYIRVCIQLARILLMLIAGGSLQEFIFYFGIDHKILFGNESFLESLYNVDFNLKSISFFFFTKLPLFLLYWVYEILHTYFVVTIQTIAFFAMLFWLFFYLFTFFFSESQENYFSKKRKLYKLFLNK